MTAAKWQKLQDFFKVNLTCADKNDILDFVLFLVSSSWNDKYLFKYLLTSTGYILYYNLFFLWTNESKWIQNTLYEKIWGCSHLPAEIGEMWQCTCVCVCVDDVHLLQVTFPESEFSGQSFPVLLHCRIMSLLLRDWPVIVNDWIYDTSSALMFVLGAFVQFYCV